MIVTITKYGKEAQSWHIDKAIDRFKLPPSARKIMMQSKFYRIVFRKSGNIVGMCSAYDENVGQAINDFIAKNGV